MLGCDMQFNLPYANSIDSRATETFDWVTRNWVQDFEIGGFWQDVAGSPRVHYEGKLINTSDRAVAGGVSSVAHVVHSVMIGVGE